MNNANFILFPLMRDIKTIPPTISIINYLADKGYKIVLFNYKTSVQFESKNVEVINLSENFYPVNFLARVVSKVKFHLAFYSYFIKNKENVKALWLGAWDVYGIDKIKGKIPLIYQFHELEEFNYGNCKKSDYVIVPEENRGWITFFQAKLASKPLLLPNIPNYKGFIVAPDQEILKLKEEGKIIVLYSGLIDNKKRNLIELISAFQYLPDEIILVIIPSFFKFENDLKILKNHIKKMNLSQRIIFLESRIPPNHLNTMATADIGVGFYSPTSLNNVYAAPNRLYEFVNFGTPVLLPNFPTFNALSKAFPLAVNVVNPENSNDIAEAVLNILNDKDLSLKSITKFQETQGNYDFFAKKIENEIFN